MQFQNGFNKVVIELLVVQFWPEIILVISNRTRAARSFDFEITRMISDQIARQEVQLPLYIKDNERNLCQDLLTIENTNSDLKVHALHYANERLVRVRLSLQKLL